jgi:hypothetical protein
MISLILKQEQMFVDADVPTKALTVTAIQLRVTLFHLCMKIKAINNSL